MIVTLDLQANTLLLSIDPPLANRGPQVATLDLATRGRLLGLEVGDRYIPIDDTTAIDPHLMRSEEVMVDIVADGGTLVLPRAGAGWEIAFPSGNRCWQPVAGDDGALRCQILTPNAPRG